MSHPNPLFDSENSFKNEKSGYSERKDYIDRLKSNVRHVKVHKPIRSKAKDIKERMVKKMFNTHGDVMKGIFDSIRNSEYHHKRNYDSNLPPGHRDEDNE